MTAATDTTTEPDTECAGAKLILLLKITVFIFLFRSVIPDQTIKKTSHRLIADERSNYYLSNPAQQQQPAVPQPIITTAAIIIMLIMLLKNLFIFSLVLS